MLGLDLVQIGALGAGILDAGPDRLAGISTVPRKRTKRSK